MAFNISDFIARFAKGGARPSLFEAMITVPNTSIGDLQNFRFLCSAAPIPPGTVAENTVSYFGRVTKFAGERKYDGTWDVTVLNDEDFGIRKVFENWQDLINHPIQNKRMSRVDATASSYRGTATVTQYGKAGDTLRTYTLFNVWPANISNIALSWSETTGVETFTVGLAYDYWTTPEVASQVQQTANV